MAEPEEIPDAVHELMIERVCAIDVAKASGTVCTRVPHEGKAGRMSRVWQVAATTRAVIEFGEHLVVEGIEKAPSSPPPIIGASGFTCWKPSAWTCGWSTPVM